MTRPSPKPAWGHAGIVLLLCLAVLSLLSLSGCASEQERIEEHLAAAEQAREAGDHETEILELRNALQLAPSDAEINLLIADASRAMGKLPNAAFYYSEAHRLDPTNVRAAMAFVSMIAADEPERAERIIQETLERDPDNPLVHVRKTELALTRGRVDDGLSAALTGVNVAPDSPATHRNLGTAYRAVVRARLLEDKEAEIPAEIHEKALAAFRKAEELERQESGRTYWFDVLEQSRIYQHWPGHEDEAMAELKRAWDVAKEADARKGMLETVDSALFLARSSGDLGIREWALEQRTQVLPASFDAWSRLARFRALSPDSGEDGSGDEQDVAAALAAARRAETVWKRAAEANPESAAFQSQYALAVHRAGRSQDALDILSSLPPALRDDPVSHMARVIIFVDLRRVDDAEAAIEAFARAHPDDPGVEIARARVDLLVGRDYAARDRLRETAGRTERVDLYMLLAEAEEKTDDPASGLAAIERAIELSDSPSAPMLATRTRLRMQLEDWRGVLTSVRGMRRRGMPIGPAVGAHHARALYELGRTDQARKEMETLVETFPQSVEVVDTFAIYEGGRSPDRARELLDAAIETHPEAAILILRRAELELEQKQPERAVAILDSYLEAAKEGDRPKLRMARARLLLRMGRVDEAVTDLKSAFEGRPRPSRAPTLLARVLQSQGRIDEAIEYLERAQATPPVTNTAIWMLGSLRLAKGDLPGAREALELAVRASPRFPLARNDLAWVLAQMGEDLDRALDLAREAKADLAGNPAAADTLGFVYLRRNLPSAALTEFDSAIELAEKMDAPRADYHYHRGLALERLDRPREAAAAFEQALAIDPAHAGAKDASARVADTGETARQG